MKKGKVNKFKIALLILSIIEIIIVYATPKQMLVNNITLWRLYVINMMFPFFNGVYIITNKKKA